MFSYSGPLTASKMPKDVRRAYLIWRGQRRRCNNKNNPAYKWYGAKGIRVKYSAREFIDWWVDEMSRFNGERPHTSRIDHSGNYEFGNIKLESGSENSREIHSRVKIARKERPVVISDYKTGEDLAIARSLAEASRMTGAAYTGIGQIASRKRGYKSVRGYTFRFYDGVL